MSRVQFTFCRYSHKSVLVQLVGIKYLCMAGRGAVTVKEGRNPATMAIEKGFGRLFWIVLDRLVED